MRQYLLTVPKEYSYHLSTVKSHLHSCELYSYQIENDDFGTTFLIDMDNSQVECLN